jgi:hypothetical protein
MDYNLYLKYEASLDLNINDESGYVFDNVFASIMHVTDKAVANAKGDEPESTKIGFVSWAYYNQALAKAYGVNMTQSPYFTLRINSKALLELDYTRISLETIDEIGAATNPNIIILLHFGISAAFRNKGIGEQVLKGLIKQMKGKCGYIIILDSEPQQFGKYRDTVPLYEVQGVELDDLEKDPEKAQWKVNAFLQRCGFRLFKNYDNVFVCNVDQVVQESAIIKHAAI